MCDISVLAKLALCQMDTYNYERYGNPYLVTGVKLLDSCVRYSFHHLVSGDSDKSQFLDASSGRIA